MKQTLAASFLALGILAATGAAAQDTIRFAVTDIDGLEALQREMGPFNPPYSSKACFPFGSASLRALWARFLVRKATA